MRLKAQKLFIGLFCLFFVSNSLSIADEIKVVDEHVFSVLITDYKKDIIFNPKTCKSDNLRNNIISLELTAIRILSAMAQSDVERYYKYLHIENKDNKYLTMRKNNILVEWNEIINNKLAKIDRSIALNDKVAIKYTLFDENPKEPRVTSYFFFKFTSDGWKLVAPDEYEIAVVRKIN